MKLTQMTGLARLRARYRTWLFRRRMRQLCDTYRRVGWAFDDASHAVAMLWIALSILEEP